MKAFLDIIKEHDRLIDTYRKEGDGTVYSEDQIARISSQFFRSNLEAALSEISAIRDELAKVENKAACRASKLEAVMLIIR